MAMDPPAIQEAFRLREYLSVLRVRKWSIVVTTVLAVAGAVLFAARQTPVYQSVARVQATNPTASVTTQNPAAAQPVMPTEQTLVGSETVADCAWVLFGAETGTVEALCGDGGRLTAAMSSAQPTPWFRRGLSVGVPQGTTILAIAFTSEDRRIARVGAQSFARAYVWYKTFTAERKVDQLRQPLLDEQAALQAQVSEMSAALIEAAAAADSATVAALNTQLTALNNSLQIVNQQLIETSPAKIEPPVIIADALPPTDPVSPNVPLTGAFGLLAGLAFGVAQAFVREQLDDGLRGRADLEERIGVPVLAVVPKVPGWKRKQQPKLVTVEEPKAAVAESYRTLRTSVLFVAAQRRIRSIMIVSATAGEGKTTTAANLAVSLADARKRVIVVSCDLRKPRIHEFFGLTGNVGLADVLLGERTAKEALQETGHENLLVMASGPTPGAPAELLQSEGMGELMEQLTEASDFVILDTAPILLVADALALTPLVGGVLFVADAQSTSRGAVVQARRQLEQLDAHVFGAVLNDFDPAKAKAYAARYGYYGSYRSGYGRGYEVPPEAAPRPPVELVEAPSERRTR